MHTNLRESPRISANKLAEYMDAGPARRRAILVDQIAPPATKLLNYEHARAGVHRILRNPARSARTWVEVASELRDRAATVPDDFEIRCLQLSAQALEAYAPCASALKTVGVVPLAARARLASLTLANVRVSVTPEVHLLEIGSEKLVGAVHFHFGKLSPLTTPALQYVACLVENAVSAAGGVPHKKYCLAADAFSGGLESAPRASKTRLRNLTAACEEISARWPSLYRELAGRQTV